MKTQNYEIGMVGRGVMGRNLLPDLGLGQAVMARQEKLRAVVRAAAEWGHRGARADGARLLRRLSQRVDAGQSHPGSARLFRSAHYERNDAKGIFRTQWEKA